jgi:hypothetical protein
MLDWLRNWWRETWRAPLSHRAYVLGMFLALALGVFLRLNGYLGHTISLWYDEAMWGSRTLHWGLLKFEIRPIGFIWLTRAIVRSFGATEAWFRLLPNLSSIVALFLMPYVASRFLNRRLLRVLLLLLFAIHPALVDFANEYKPYGFEVLLHLIPVVLYLRLEQTQRLAYFYALLVYLPVCFLLAYNISFVYPGVLLLCLRHAWFSPARRQLLTATLLSGALCAATPLVVYKLALSNVVQAERTENYWGRKYDVFYHSKEKASRIDWTLERFNDMTAFIGLRRENWDKSPRISEKAARELGAADRLFWAGLSLVGLYTLWKRRREQLLLLALPLGVMLVINALGKWPLGAFRTNIFTSVYVFLFPLIGMETLAASGPTVRRILATSVLGLTLIPGFAYGFDWHGHKRTYTRDHYHREVLERLFELRKKQIADNPELGPARLMMDAHTYHPHGYYLKDHPVYRQRFNAFFKANFNQDNVARGSLGPRIQQRLQRDNQPVWVVTSKPSVMEEVDTYAKRNTKVLIREEIAGEHLILLLAKKQP